MVNINTQKTNCQKVINIFANERKIRNFNNTRQPNLNMDIVQQIAKGLGLAFVPERGCQLYQDLPTAPLTLTNQHTAMRKFEFGGNDKKVRIRVGEVTATGSVTENGVAFPSIITLTL